MTLTVPLSPETEKALQERARQRGQEVAAYVQSLIDQELQAPQTRDNGAVPSSSDPLPPGLLPIPPGIQRSLDAFLRDLPELMKTHYGQWVAYHGDRCLGIGRNKTPLVQECLRRGLKRDEFIVEGVMHQITYDDE